MGKQRRKLTRAEKAEKARRRAEFMWIFIRGKQVRVRRPPTIDGLSVEEFIERNADPLWLDQHGMWESIEPDAFGSGSGVPEERAVAVFDAGAEEVDRPDESLGPAMREDLEPAPEASASRDRHRADRRSRRRR